MADAAVTVLDSNGVARAVDAQTTAGGDYQQTITIGNGATNGLIAALDADGSLQVETNRASNVTYANVTSGTTAVTLLAANTNRRGAIIFNDSTAVLYVKYGTSAQTGVVTSASFSHKVAAGGSWIVDVPTWEGAIQGLWAAANGAARVTDISE